jgi:hypothetical protein
MKRLYAYHAQTTSKAGLLRMVAANYLPNEYFSYSYGYFRDEEQARRLELDIICRYELALSKDQRYRRKLAGLANLQFLRYRLFYLFLATPGVHPFYRQQSDLRDFRRQPLHFAGYAVALRAGDPSVSLSPATEQRLRSYFLAVALVRRATDLAREFRSLPWLPYGPVVGQVLSILSAVNERRGRRGYAEVPEACVRRKLKVCRPFDWRDADYDPTAGEGESSGGADSGEEAAPEIAA